MNSRRAISIIKTILATGIIFALTIILLYFTTFNDKLSSSSDDWANFGSLLSGAFTLCGSLATIATLLFIHEENKDNKEVIQHQTEALAFEQYLKHRELFINLITETTKATSNNIEIYNIDDLYKRIFANNKPTNRPIYAVDLKSTTNCKPGDLKDIIASYNILTGYVTQNSPEVAIQLRKLTSMLHIRCLEPPCNGDLIFKGTNTGINIYDIQSKTQEISKIINALLYFTGNDDIADIHEQASSRVLKLAIIKHFRTNNPDPNFHVNRTRNTLTTLEKIYLELSDYTCLNHLLKNTKNYINKSFSSKEDVKELLKKTNALLKIYEQESSNIANSGKTLNKEEQQCLSIVNQSFIELSIMSRFILSM